MAKPQPDQFTRLSNELLEAYARATALPYTTRVLFVIWRMTYGYQTQKSKIPLSVFAEKTGIRKPHVCRALAELQQYRLIGRAGSTFWIQKDYDKWTCKASYLGPLFALSPSRSDGASEQSNGSKTRFGTKKAKCTFECGRTDAVATITGGMAEN